MRAVPRILLGMSFVTATAAAASALPTSSLVAFGRPTVMPLLDGSAETASRVDPGRLEPHAFYFTRAAYSFTQRDGARLPVSAAETADPGGGWYATEACDAGFCGWATDYPKAELQFLTVLRRLTNLDAYPAENAVRLDDPNLRRFPFIYAVEVGYMALTAAEVRGLRKYLEAGGFLLVDDFWGTSEWQRFEEQMRRVFPEYPIVDIPIDHPVFHAYYDIEEIVQVPNVGQGVSGGPTHEQDGYVPHLRGIFDPSGRLMVAISWNSDLGDAWEWAEQPRYPLEFSTYAYELGVNLVVYAMSH